MPLAAPRVCLALDASQAAGVRVQPGLTGARVTAWAERRLPDGALRPGPLGDNLPGAEAVAGVLRELVAELAVPPGARARLVLPDGVARLALLAQPRGVDLVEFARFRLAASLPYAAEEAQVGVLPAGGGQLLVAAVRRALVSSYEELARACGLVPEGVLLAPLAVVGGFVRRPPLDHGVALWLGDSAYLLAAWRGSRLAGLRVRWRCHGGSEAERLRAEARRSALAARLDGPLRLVLGGRGALALAAQLGGDARLLTCRPEPPPGLSAEPSSWAWVAAAA